MVRKIASLAMFVVFGLFFCSSLMAQGDEAAALKQRVLSKLKACDCEAPLTKCGDCPVAAEIKDYVGKLIQAKVPENKMLGYVLKSFPSDVIVEENSKENAAQQLSQIVPADSPRLSAETMSHDFGKVSKKVRSINHEFTLRNTGKKDLIIKNLRASCSCSRVSLRTQSGNSPDFDSKGSGPGWQATIKPGETAILEIVLNLDDFQAGQKTVSRQALMTTNDPLQSVAVFNVSLEVIES